MSNKDFCPDVTDPEERAALVAGFLSAHGVPGGRPELAKLKEESRQTVDAPEPIQI